ncbi:MAG: Beta-lactamase domain protein [Desulfotomaculum sp. 46_296]|nr:MAG: Beta-lactamase domain protein [Desulfotomaculum sp. 46_296]
MPKVRANKKVFEDALLLIERKGLKIKTAKAGVVVSKQDKLEVSFIAPVETGYDDLNNYSTVTRIRYGKTAFLLTGDAGTMSEAQMIASGADLKADV